MKGLENDPFLLGLGPAYMTHLPSLSIKIPDFVLLRGWSRFLFKIHGRSSWPPHFIAWVLDLFLWWPHPHTLHKLVHFVNFVYSIFRSLIINQQVFWGGPCTSFTSSYEGFWSSSRISYPFFVHKHRAVRFIGTSPPLCCMKRRPRLGWSSVPITFYRCSKRSGQIHFNKGESPYNTIGLKSTPQLNVKFINELLGGIQPNTYGMSRFRLGFFRLPKNVNVILLVVTGIPGVFGRPKVYFLNLN